MAITVLLEALSLFLCDCPQQEVMSPVFSSLNTGNGPERNTARYVCVCQSVWGNYEGEKSIICPSVLNIVCVSCSLIVARLNLKRKKKQVYCGWNTLLQATSKAWPRLLSYFHTGFLWIFVLLSVSLLLNRLTQCKIKGSWFLCLSMCNYLSENRVSLYE